MDNHEFEKQAAIVARTFGISLEDAIMAITNVCEAAKKVSEEVIEAWENIKERVIEWVEDYEFDNDPIHPAYKTKSNHRDNMKSQVLINKPKRVFARTNC